MNALIQNKSRITLKDVARAAGVSEATVDRVLNERGDVSEKSVCAVIEAARELGLKRVLPTPHKVALRVEVCLTRPDTEYFQRFNAAFQAATIGLDNSITVHRSFIPEDRPDQLARRIMSRGTEAVIFYGATDTAVVRDAVARARAAGKTVITVTAELRGSATQAHIGIDDFKAGRTAAYFMGRMSCRDGDYIVVRHSAAYRGQSERVEGFEAGITDYAPGRRVAAYVNNHDKLMLTTRLVSDAIERCPNLAGIYCAGAGRFAVGAAIKRAGLSGQVGFIAHELTDRTYELLQDGVLSLAIDQNPEQQALAAIHYCLAESGHSAKQPGTSIPFTLFSPENLPERH